MRIVNCKINNIFSVYFKQFKVNFKVLGGGGSYARVYIHST